MTDPTELDDDDLGGDSADLEKQALEEAFPDHEWTPDRVAAMKSFIQLCQGGYAEEEEEPAEGGLGAIFGGR